LAPLPHERPPITEDLDTEDLPALPQRERSIPASCWRQAPDALRHLGDELGTEPVYLRRIGRYLLWRAGDPRHEFVAMAIAADDLGERWTFPGVGPDGNVHERFRTWKEALRGNFPDENAGSDM